MSQSTKFSIDDIVPGSSKEDESASVEPGSASRRPPLEDNFEEIIVHTVASLVNGATKIQADELMEWIEERRLERLAREKELRQGFKGQARAAVSKKMTPRVPQELRSKITNISRTEITEYEDTSDDECQIVETTKRSIGTKQASKPFQKVGISSFTPPATPLVPPTSHKPPMTHWVMVPGGKPGVVRMAPPKPGKVLLMSCVVPPKPPPKNAPVLNEGADNQRDTIIPEKQLDLTDFQFVMPRVPKAKEPQPPPVKVTKIKYRKTKRDTGAKCSFTFCPCVDVPKKNHKMFRNIPEFEKPWSDFLQIADPWRGRGTEKPRICSCHFPDKEPKARPDLKVAEYWKVIDRLRKENESMVEQVKGISEKFRKIFRDDQLERIFNYPGHQVQWKLETMMDVLKLRTMTSFDVFRKIRRIMRVPLPSDRYFGVFLKDMEQAQERKEKEAIAATARTDVATHSVAGPSGTQSVTSESTKTVAGDADDIFVQTLLATEEQKKEKSKVKNGLCPPKRFVPPEDPEAFKATIEAIKEYHASMKKRIRDFGKRNIEEVRFRGWNPDGTPILGAKATVPPGASTSCKRPANAASKRSQRKRKEDDDGTNAGPSTEEPPKKKTTTKAPRKKKDTDQDYEPFEKGHQHHNGLQTVAQQRRFEPINFDFLVQSEYEPHV